MYRTEKDLVGKLTEHFSNQMILEEIGVGYGVSDLIIIRNRKAMHQLITERSGIYFESLDEIKVLAFIKMKRRTFNDIMAEHFLSKPKLKSILNKLIIKGAIIEKENQFIFSNKIHLLSPKVYAIEAKLEDWNKGLAQALRYQRFACRTYLAIDTDYIHRVDIDELQKFNVGLYSVGKKVKEIFRPKLSSPTDKVMTYKVAEEIIRITNERGLHHQI